MVEAAVTAGNTCDTKPLRVGLDIGSTTVKAVVLDQTDSLDAVLFSDYRRHHANVRATVAGLLEDIHKELEAVAAATSRSSGHHRFRRPCLGR